ncbi:MAG: hypothetical protein QXF15_02785 [Candidatus Aenigmatarchaeota archaeon]
MPNKLTWDEEIDILEKIDNFSKKINEVEFKVNRLISTQEKLEKEINGIKNQILEISDIFKNNKKLLFKKINIDKINEKIFSLEKRFKIIEAIISELKIEEKEIEKEYSKKINLAAEKTILDLKKLIDIEIKKINDINTNEVNRIKNIINSNLSLVEKTIENEINSMRNLAKDVKENLSKINEHEKIIKIIIEQNEKQMKILNNFAQEIKNLKDETKTSIKNIRNEIYNKFDDEISNLLSIMQRDRVKGDYDAVKNR